MPLARFTRLPRSMRWYLYANAVLMLIGVGLIIGFQSRTGKTLGITVNSYVAVGSAITGSAIVGFLYFSYMRAEKRYDKAIRLADEWGLIDIHPDRKDEERYRSKISEAKNRIDIQAITLSRLYTDLSDEIEKAGRNGVEIRMLLIEPGSEMCEWIEEANDEYSDLSERIETSVRNWQSLNTDNITIRYYQRFPVNYFRIDQYAFFGPYFTEPSRNTDTFLAESDRKLAESYRNHFRDVWEQYSTPV